MGGCWIWLKPEQAFRGRWGDREIGSRTTVGHVILELGGKWQSDPSWTPSCEEFEGVEGI